MIRWSIVGLVLWAGPSQAMIQCIYYDQMVSAAVDVIQLDAAKIGAADENGMCGISGHVSRVFAGALQVDDWVDSSAPCDNAKGLDGPTIWTDAAALAQAKVIELHLDGDGQIAGYGAGLILLDATTETPAWKPVCGE